MAHDAPWEHYHDLGERISTPSDTIVLTTAGFDIGSSTSQLVFSQITLTREDSHYVVTDRAILHESEIILTPYAAPDVIDANRLAAFIDREYRLAGVERNAVDSGAVILTGIALASQNARAIADAIADDSGKFVAVSAGDLLETRLSARGAGAPAISSEVDGILIHIDIGGGTTKLSAWKGGKLLSLAAIDVGARLVTMDDNGVIVRIEEPATRVRSDLDLDLWPGEPLKPEVANRLAGALARNVLRYAGVLHEPPRGQSLLRTAPLFPPDEQPHVAAVIFTGGVSEYVYGREQHTFGDLGLLLGTAVREALQTSNVNLIPCQRGIRATVLGVAQHSVQLTGTTIFVSDPSILPLRNIPVLRPKFDLSRDVLDTGQLCAAIDDALALYAEEGKSFGLAFDWQGPATYDRLGAVTEAIVASLDRRLELKSPCLVIVDGDVAGVLGARLAEAVAGRRGVICVDGVHAHELDHIDVGELLPNTGTLPVVIKSLLFAGSIKRNHSHGRHHT